MKRRAACTILASFFLAAMLFWCAGPAGAAPLHAAPEFSLKDLNGKVRHLSDYRGKLVLVNFWATWCPPCRKEIPSMERLYRKLGNRGFVILGVEEGEGWAVVAPVAEELGITYPVLLDRDGSVSHEWHMIGLPTSYLVDPRGRVVKEFVGGRNWLDPQLQAQLLRFLPPLPSRRPVAHAPAAVPSR